MKKQQIEKEAREAGFFAVHGQGEPVWFMEMNDNLNLLVYLLSKKS